MQTQIVKHLQKDSDGIAPWTILFYYLYWSNIKNILKKEATI